METASRTMVPMYTSAPAMKKPDMGKGPFISAAQPARVTKMDASCSTAYTESISQGQAMRASCTGSPHRPGHMKAIGQQLHCKSTRCNPYYSYGQRSTTRRAAALPMHVCMFLHFHSHSPITGPAAFMSRGISAPQLLHDARSADASSTPRNFKEF